MVFNWVDFAVSAVLVVAGYASLRRTFQRSLAEKQRATEHELSALAALVKSLQAQIEELGEPRLLHPDMASELDLESVAAASDKSVELEEEEVTAEVMAVISAAITSFLGKKVRIRSARLLQSPQEVISAWSQQGRVFVQASHNLRSRR